MVYAPRNTRGRVKEPMPVETVKTFTKPIGGEKNGGERVITKRVGPKWYPTVDVKRPVPSRRHVHKPTRLRKKIAPGTVLILVAGVYRGMRVIFLKQLPSGLLMVTGPFCVNGIPLRRVDQRYVIATSTKIDIGSVDVAKFDDSYFKRPVKKTKKKTDADQFFEEDDGSGTKKELTKEKIADQKAVDKAIVETIASVPYLKAYLKSRFSLNKGQYPHEMKF